MNFLPGGLTKTELLAGFGIKVLLGCIYGYVFLHVYNGDDTWKAFTASLKETQRLLDDPASFFSREYTPAHSIEIGKNWKEIITFYLNDLQYALLEKNLALMNLISRGNYYVDVVLFNSIIFFGHYWLYRLMYDLFPSKRKLFFAAIFFFLPAVFWLSGIRVDGLLFFFLSLLLYNFCGAVKPGTVKTICIILGFLGVLICRPQIAALLTVGMIAYALSKSIQRNNLLVFACTYLVAIVLFFAGSMILPGGGPAGSVISRQEEFMALNGTRFHLDKLENSPFSFISILPQAFANTFLRPFPWEVKGLLQLMYAAEVAAFWLIIILAVCTRHEYWKIRFTHPVILLLLFFAISVYLTIGYIVPFPGAIVRYKVIAELLIICCMISISKWGESTHYNNL